MDRPDPTPPPAEAGRDGDAARDEGHGFTETLPADAAGWDEAEPDNAGAARSDAGPAGDRPPTHR